MGTVYEALDPLINRKVAVKTMAQGLADSGDLRARFMQEAQAAGGLRHPNLVTVYDLGEDNGQPYIAMEFVEGTDLEKVIQNHEPLSIEWKLDVIRQICDGLAHAHHNGIVHRDIKPANIRVTPDGEVKIMDFGIAHLQSSTMTKDGLVLGTVHYMAPEQIRGQKVDHRSDIFSVGVIAYELMAERKPFDGESISAIMLKILNESPDFEPLPKTAYTPGLEEIVMKALRRNPEERYQSLDEMHQDLKRLVRETVAKLSEHSSQAPPEESGRMVEGPASPAPIAVDSGPGAKGLVEEPEKRAEPPAARGAERGTGPVSARVRETAPGDLSAQHEGKEQPKELLGDMERAREAGQLQRALGLCRRLLELDPKLVAARQAASEIETTIREREVEQLSGVALAYATDGEIDLAQKIATKIERLAPENPRYLELRKYLEEEVASKRADALTATAQDHLALGNLKEGIAAAEAALAVHPAHSVARQIRDTAARVLAAQQKAVGMATLTPLPSPPEAPPPTRLPPQVPAAGDEAPSPAAMKIISPGPPMAPEPSPTALTPLPEGTPANAEAASLLEAGRRLLRERSPGKALVPLEAALVLEPSHPGIVRVVHQARAFARRSEVED